MVAVDFGANGTSQEGKSDAIYLAPLAPYAKNRSVGVGSFILDYYGRTSGSFAVKVA